MRLYQSVCFASEKYRPYRPYIYAMLHCSLKMIWNPRSIESHVPHALNSQSMAHRFAEFSMWFQWVNLIHWNLKSVFFFMNIDPKRCFWYLKIIGELTIYTSCSNWLGKTNNMVSIFFSLFFFSFRSNMGVYLLHIHFGTLLVSFSWC